MPSLRIPKIFIGILLLLSIQSGVADPVDVDAWEVFRATTQPQFRMSFPGPVKELNNEAGITYSGDVQPADDIGLQVIVPPPRRTISASETDPNEAMEVFTSDPEGTVTSKEIIKDGEGFVLVYATLLKEDGLVIISLHNTHFLGYNIFDVSYAVIAEDTIGEQRLKEAVELGRKVMEKFRAG